MSDREPVPVPTVESITRDLKTLYMFSKIPRADHIWKIIGPIQDIPDETTRLILFTCAKSQVSRDFKGMISDARAMAARRWGDETSGKTPPQ
jgi:hypothetical protein